MLFRTALIRAAVDPEKPHRIPVVAITSEIARDRAIILATAIQQDLPIFMANPVCLAHHPWMFNEQPRASVVLGHVVEDSIEIHPDTDDGGGYVAMILDLAEEINPEAKLTGDLIRRRDIRSVSIGWLDRGSVTRKSPREEIDALPRFAREALLSSACDLVYTRIELFEISVVYGAQSDYGAIIQLRSLWAAREEQPRAAEWRVCGSRSLPIDDDEPWDKGEAEASLGEDWGAWERAHVLCYGPRDRKGSYRLPFARKVGDALRAVTGGVQACAGGHGIDAVDGVPEGVREDARDLIAHYYGKFDPPAEAPWERDEERSMSQSAAQSRKVKGAHARVGHAPTNDIMHRLEGAIESLSAGFCWCCGPCTCGVQTDEPPDPEVCYGVVRVLEQVIADLNVLAGADDDDAALAPDSPTACMCDCGACAGCTKSNRASTRRAAAHAREGKRLSAATVAALDKIHDYHRETRRHHNRCMRAIEEAFDSDALADEIKTSIGEAQTHGKEARLHHGRAMRALSDLIANVDEDSYADDGNRLSADVDEDDIADRAMRAAVMRIK